VTDDRVSWGLARVPNGAIVGKWSKLHRLNAKTGRTRCGLIPGLNQGHSHEGRCSRCFR
jgi:hypothetical protein